MSGKNSSLNRLKRNSGLDLLRFIAVSMVIVRHSDFTGLLQNAGWAGVDLFFVLSGFLVSGLLFREYQRTEHVYAWRFFVRRGLKIYPSFYFFLIISLIVKGLIAGIGISYVQVLSELFFLQSYIRGLWDHTWSLAVEEHFYFLLLCFTMATVKFRLLRRNRFMAAVLLVLTLISPIIRSVEFRGDSAAQFVFQTHLRLDPLFTGVFISYIWVFSQKFRGFVQKNKWFLLCLGLVMSSIPFIEPPGTYFMNTTGGLLMNWGFALLVISIPCVSFGKIALPIIQPMAYIGMHSYSVYLWHLMIKGIMEHFFPERWNWPYLILCIPVGIAMSLIIEFPILKWRDRKYPSSTASVVIT